MRAATALYKPVGLVLGALSGAVAGAVFKQVWKKLGHEEAPGATDRERTWQEVSLLPCRARSSRRSTAAARRRRSA